MIKQILVFAVFLLVSGYLLNQARKPNRWVGRVFLWMMNSSHSALTDWGLEHVTVEKHFQVLDVGCGGGRTIEKLATRVTGGKIYGVDYASGSVAVSRRKSEKLIRAGQVEIHQASVSQLPFPDGQFDLVTSVESQYYWPDLVNDMREILRVLRPGGILIVIAESYQGSRYNFLERPIMWFLRSNQLSLASQRDLFLRAGFADVQLFEERSKGWMCASGRKSLPEVLT